MLSQPHLLTGNAVVRLTLSLSLLIVVTCLALSAVFVRRHLSAIRAGLFERGQAIGELAAREAELGVLSGNVDMLRQLGTIVLAQHDVVYCTVLDRRGAVLLDLGDGRGRHSASIPGGEPETVRDGVWEFRAPVLSRVARPQREELGFGGADGGAAAQQQIGALVIGISRASLDAEWWRTALTAAGFTLLISALSVLSAVLLMRGPLRALASTATLATERERVAELKARFVMQASHEFRTPLAVILAASDVLRRYAGRLTDNQRERRLEKIQASVRQMIELLEDVLTVGRADSGKLPFTVQPVDLATLCRDVVADLEPTVGLAHRIACTAPESLAARVDPKLVRQILRNLLSNALKYSPDGGGVGLEIVVRGAAVELRVSDQGIGIAPADQPHLFEPFYRGAKTDEFAGSGLGLTITKKAVEMHGGTIGVRSSVGAGTTFTVTLPLDAAAAADRSGDDAAVEPPAATADGRGDAERLLRIAEASHAVLWEWDLRTDRAVYTPHWKLLLGYASDALPTAAGAEDSRDWFEHLHPDDAPRLVELFSSRLVDSAPSSYEAEFRMRGADGSYRWILSHATLHCDASGEPYEVRGTHLDITARKQTEVERAKLTDGLVAANQVKSDFLAHVTHELRSPLNVIIGYGEMLEAEAKGMLPAEQADWIQRITEQGRHLLALVEDTLDLSRLDSGRVTVHVQEIDLAALLDEVCGEALVQWNRSPVDLRWSRGKGVPRVCSDPDKLRIILSNLVGNAMKYTETGAVVATTEERDGGVAIAVIDTGIGIAADQHAAIFEPFHQVRLTGGGTGGVGLGLYLVRRLTELLGGRITVESAPGRGSTFRVWLPTREPAVEVLPSAAPRHGNTEHQGVAV